MEMFRNLACIKQQLYCKIKLYHDQRNAQVFVYLSIYSTLHVSGFLLAHLQRQVYNFGSGSSLLGMVSALGR
jgi:hypothetical protein